MMPLKHAACPILTRTSMRRRLANKDHSDYLDAHLNRTNFLVGDRVTVDTAVLKKRLPKQQGNTAIIKEFTGNTAAWLYFEDTKEYNRSVAFETRFLEPIDCPDDAPDGTAVYVSGAEAPDDDQVNGWYAKKDASQQQQPVNWKNRSQKKFWTDFRGTMCRSAVDHFYENDSTGYFIYRQKAYCPNCDGYGVEKSNIHVECARCKGSGARKLKLCASTKCVAILRYEDRNAERCPNCKQNIAIDDKTGKWYKEDAAGLWYICGPDGQPRYKHKHPMSSINQLTRNNWKALDYRTYRTKDWRQDQNLRVVEYPN